MVLRISLVLLLVSSSSSHSEHGSRLYLPMLNPAFSLSFWPISSVVLSSLCQELSALCWSRIPISKKHLLWSLLPLSLPTSSNWSSSRSPARRFLPASNTTGISNKIQRTLKNRYRNFCIDFFKSILSQG